MLAVVHFMFTLNLWRHADWQLTEQTVLVIVILHHHHHRRCRAHVLKLNCRRWHQPMLHILCSQRNNWLSALMCNMCFYLQCSDALKYLFMHWCMGVCVSAMWALMCECGYCFNGCTRKFCYTVFECALTIEVNPVQVLILILVVINIDKQAEMEAFCRSNQCVVAALRRGRN